MKNFLKNISSNHTFANSWFFKLKFLPDATSIGNKIENNIYELGNERRKNQIKKLKEINER